MSHKATNWAISQRGLEPATKVLLWHLADRHNKDTGRCDPSQDRLADDCEMSRATVNRHLKKLEDVGLIQRVQRTNPTTKRQESTFYLLAMDHDLSVSHIDTRPLSSRVSNEGRAVSQMEREPCLNSVSQFETLTLGLNQEEEPGREPTPDGAGSLFSAMEEDQPSGTTDGSSPSAEKQEDPFEIFWKEFPPGRKTDKPKARKLFWSIVQGTSKTLTKATTDQLIDGAKRFARSEPDPQYTPMPTTWLNGERWTAEPEPQRKAVSSGYGGGHRYRPPTGEVVR